MTTAEHEIRVHVERLVRESERQRALVEELAEVVRQLLPPSPAQPDLRLVEDGADAR